MSVWFASLVVQITWEKNFWSGMIINNEILRKFLQIRNSLTYENLKKWLQKLMTNI